MRNFILVIIAISSGLWQLTASSRAKAKVRSADPVLMSKAARECVNSKIKKTDLQSRDRRLELVDWRFNLYFTYMNYDLGLDEIKASRARACFKKYLINNDISTEKQVDMHYCLQRYGLQDDLRKLGLRYTTFNVLLGFNLQDGNNQTGTAAQVLDCVKLLDPPPRSISDYQFQALSPAGQVCARGLFNNELDVINFDQHIRNYQTELYYLVKKYTVKPDEEKSAVDQVAIVFETCFFDGEFERQAGVTNANNQRLAMYKDSIDAAGSEGMYTDMKNLIDRLADNLSPRWDKTAQINCFVNH